jgi:hypothetical protein
MSTNSETIIPSISRTLHGSASLTGDPYKGDGFYGRSDGLHTVQVSITGFIGRISIQGTLEVNPTESDWFTVELGTGTMSVDTTGLIAEQNITFVDYTAATTNTKTYNFIGNLVWVRAKISNWTDGAINSIKLNH